MSTPPVGPPAGPLSHLELRRLQPSSTCVHDPRSVYVERFWLGVLGPSAVWFLRMARRELDSATPTTPAVVDLRAAARQLGIGHQGGRHSPMMRTIDRCATFGMAAVTDQHGTLAVRTLLPPVPHALQSRLPSTLREELRQWSSTARSPHTVEQESWARRTATSFLELGLGLHESCERLVTCGISPELARRATAWAWSTDAEQGAGPAHLTMR